MKDANNLEQFIREEIDKVELRDIESPDQMWRDFSDTLSVDSPKGLSWYRRLLRKIFLVALSAGIIASVILLMTPKALDKKDQSAQLQKLETSILKESNNELNSRRDNLIGHQDSDVKIASSPKVPALVSPSAISDPNQIQKQIVSESSRKNATGLDTSVSLNSNLPSSAIKTNNIISGNNFPVSRELSTNSERETYFHKQQQVADSSARSELVIDSNHKSSVEELLLSKANSTTIAKEKQELVTNLKLQPIGNGLSSKELVMQLLSERDKQLHPISLNNQVELPASKRKDLWFGGYSFLISKRRPVSNKALGTFSLYAGRQIPISNYFDIDMQLSLRLNDGYIMSQDSVFLYNDLGSTRLTKHKDLKLLWDGELRLGISKVINNRLELSGGASFSYAFANQFILSEEVDRYSNQFVTKGTAGKEQYRGSSSWSGLNRLGTGVYLRIGTRFLGIYSIGLVMTRRLNTLVDTDVAATVDSDNVNQFGLYINRYF